MKALLGVLLACTAALAALIVLVRDDAPAPVEAPQAALLGELAALRGAIDALTAEVAALREERSGPALQAPAAAREPVGNERPEELTERLDRLAAALEALNAALRAGTGFPVAPQLQARERDALLDRELDQAALAALKELSDVRRSFRHLGWTVQQVVERYGVPEALYFSEGSMKVRYRWPGGSVIFELIDGGVVRVHG